MVTEFLHRIIPRIIQYGYSNIAIATHTKCGGYEYEFVNTPPDRCICRICHLPSRDAYMTGPCCQGQTVCKSCLDHWQVAAGTCCPVCRNGDGYYTQNYPVDREIKSLHIYCSNKERGCEWQGELNDIRKHLGNSDGCQFVEVKCSYECGKMIQRRHLTSHVETECPHCKVDCQYCHDTGERQFIEGQHKEECPKLPLPCPNKCEVGSVPREDMEQHRNECPLEIINCSYDCEEKLKRQCLANHLQTECPRRKVKCRYCHDIGEHQFIEGQHKEECPKFPLPCPNKCEVGSVPREDMEAHRKECPLEKIQCEYHSVGCKRGKVARKDKEEHDNKSMKEHLMMTKNEVATTKAQLDVAMKQISSLPTLLMNVQLHAQNTSNKEDRSIQLDTMATIFKYVCPVNVKMSEYKAKKENKTEWYSDPFYTHYKGYKMCLNVDAAGYGNSKGTHLSVYLCLMKGPHDDELTWPLRGKFEIKLLSQISDSEHYSACVVYDNRTSDGNANRIIHANKATGYGMHQFISNEYLNKVTSTCQLLKDDNLFFHINFIKAA